VRGPVAALVLLAAAGTAAAGDPEHPLFTSGEEEWMELRGRIEAGVRDVRGKEGRYEQDVNLDGGFRLLDAELTGTSLQDGLWADEFSMHLRGLGDPNRLAGFRVRADGAYDLRFHADRLEYIYRATADAHPWDSTRDSVGASLSLHLGPGTVLRVTEERLRRTGDARLEMRYRDDQYFPAAAVLAYEGRFHSAGLDGSRGDFRWGGTVSWSHADDDSVRVLEAPASNAGDTGRYRNLSDIDRRAVVGRAGLKLLDRKVDLSVTGGYHAGETDSRVRGAEAVTPLALPGTAYTDLRATTEANARGWFGRGEVLVLPHGDWEVLGRYEARSDRVLGGADILLRDLPPPSVPAGPYTPLPESSRTEADLTRTGLEVRWRASKAWRFRAGGEQVRERIVFRENELYGAFLERVEAWNPVTVAATAGADWTPVEGFDASLLARGTRARRAATALSADEGRTLTARLRARGTAGWHATAFARVKQRNEDSTDSSSLYDAYGWSGGHAGEGHFVELTLSRRDLSTSSDTYFVVDASSPTGTTRTPHRVSHDESVTQASLDFSKDVAGPLRAFGSLRWADGTGDARYAQSDLSLGLGWRLSRSAELKAEGRRVAYAEGDRSVDDYEARILTVSVAYEF
jgi:hypothetical protein